MDVSQALRLYSPEDDLLASSKLESQIYLINYCTCLYLENFLHVKARTLEDSLHFYVSQASDRIWHAGLLHKINQLITVQEVKILSLYTRDRIFQVHYGEATSRWKPTKLGCPSLASSTIATFADDTAIVSSH